MREPTFTTLFTKLFKGENQHLPHYLQRYINERTNIYHIIYKTIKGREPTFTTLFTKLFKGENQHLPHYLQNYLRERTLRFIFGLTKYSTNTHIDNKWFICSSMSIQWLFLDFLVCICVKSSRLKIGQNNLHTDNVKTTTYIRTNN
jgi:hypothetical protein